MTAPKDHYQETKKILKAISKETISGWLLNEGYYPEQYVVPPCFQVRGVTLNKRPYYSLNNKQKVPRRDIEKVSFPKSSLVDRTFGIYDFKIYHDIVWHLKDHWDEITEHLFSDDNYIYHYSFPLPISSEKIGKLGPLRAGRMIYEYIEMAEKDLLEESYNYKYILRTDVTNFYNSIYTHSIAWALHSKETVRKKENLYNYDLIGNKLDLLIRNSNDRCTNGIPIGPAVSDLIAEIVLCAVDRNASQFLSKTDVQYIGVRYKDDYRFLCHSEDDAQSIIKILQRSLSMFNLTLHEGKSSVTSLPDGLFRSWKIRYQSHSLAYKKKIPYKLFENTILKVMDIDKATPNTGVIDKFLSELTDDKNQFKLEVTEKNVRKLISLLVHLKDRRVKSFPQILAIIEAIYNNSEAAKIKDIILKLVKEHFESLIKDIEANLYEILWTSYFIKSNGLFELNLSDYASSKFLMSIIKDTQELFQYNDFSIYQRIEPYSHEQSILEYLKVFNRSNKDQ